MHNPFVCFLVLVASWAFVISKHLTTKSKWHLEKFQTKKSYINKYNRNSWEAEQKISKQALPKINLKIPTGEKSKTDQEEDSLFFFLNSY